MKNLKKKMLLQEFGINLSELGVNFGRDVTAEYSDFDSIAVKRMDESLFNFVPDNSDWDGSCGNSFSYHTVFADFGNGYEKLDVKAGGESGSNYAHSSTDSYEGETLIEWFIRNNELRIPFTILVFFRSKSSWDQSSDHNYILLTIYKQAKNDNLVKEVIESAIAKVKAEVVAETSF